MVVLWRWVAAGFVDLLRQAQTCHWTLTKTGHISVSTLTQSEQGRGTKRLKLHERRLRLANKCKIRQAPCSDFFSSCDNRSRATDGNVLFLTHISRIFLDFSCK